MRIRWVSHTWKFTQWNIFLFESSDKSPYWTNPYHIGFRYKASLSFDTYFGQCPNDTYILLHIPLHVCPHYPHTGLTTATAPSGHQMAIVVSRTAWVFRAVICHGHGYLNIVITIRWVPGFAFVFILYFYRQFNNLIFILRTAPVWICASSFTCIYTITLICVLSDVSCANSVTIISTFTLVGYAPSAPCVCPSP